MRTALVVFAVCALAIATTGDVFGKPESRSVARFADAQPSRIAFWRSVSDGSSGDVWVMNADGTHQKRLAPYAEPDLTWSPDGRFIAFASYRGSKSERNIWVMNADGTQARQIRGTLGGSGPDWSPDGRTIAMGAEARNWIRVVNVDGSGSRRVTRGWTPSWSHDGRRIAFSHKTRHDFASSEIFVVGADGEDRRRLTRNELVDGAPAWSPNGQHIAFVRVGDARLGVVHVMDANGRNARRLATGYSPSWSPDGRRIAFMRNFTIWVMNADGTGQHRISPRPGRPRTSLGLLNSPVWSPVP